MNYNDIVKRFGSGRTFRKIGSGEFAAGRRYYISEMKKASIDGRRYNFHVIESENYSFVMVCKISEAEVKEICTIRDIDFLDTVLDMCKSRRL